MKIAEKIKNRLNDKQLSEIMKYLETDDDGLKSLIWRLYQMNFDRQAIKRTLLFIDVIFRVGKEGVPVKLHPTQRLPMFYYLKGAKDISVSAGRRWGKSFFGAIVLQIETAFKSETMIPQRNILIVAPTREVTERVFQYLKMFNLEMKCWGESPSQFTDREKKMTFGWGSLVQGKTVDNPTGLLGEGAAFILIDEADLIETGIMSQYLDPLRADTNGVKATISSPKGQTNDNYRYWNYCRKNMLGGNKNYFAGRFPTKTNPKISKSWLEKQREMYEYFGQSSRFREEFEADPMARSGSIYPMFQPSKGDQYWHVDPTIKPTLDIPFEFFVDAGARNPTAILQAQVYGDGTIYILKEWNLTLMSPSEIADIIKQAGTLEATREIGFDGLVYEGQEPETELVIVDPSALPLKVELNKSGLPVDNRTRLFHFTKDTYITLNAVDDGIRIVQIALGCKDRALIKIHPRCVNLIKTIQEYHYDGDKESPKKDNDHAVDALRYGVVAHYAGSPFIMFGNSMG